MPFEITMPQLSDTMTEGTVVKWVRKEGDVVKAGEHIADIETDKATMEMESSEAGTLAVQLVSEGGKVTVGSPIAVLATGKDKPDEVKARYSAGSKSGSPAITPTVASAAPVAKKDAGVIGLSGGQKLGPITRTSFEQEPHETVSTAVEVPPSKITSGTKGGNGNGGDDRVRISPLARRIAEERGIDINAVTGTGPGGRIVQSDVLAFQPSKAASGASGSAVAGRQSPARAPSVESLPQRLASGEKKTVALTKMRQTIALRLQQSTQNLPHFYETIDIDMEAVVQLREKLNKSLDKEGVRISVGDFVARAVASALKLHPIVNSHFQGTEITQFGDVHLGMAVALDNGLIVPVLRNIDQMGLREIRVRSADLVDRARAQKLKGDELTGATFTVSNLGSYGIREFTAIINPPEVAILAVGNAEPRAVVRNGQVVSRHMMTVTMSSDHRVIDGATAAEFLRTLKGLLEEPGMMLV